MRSAGYTLIELLVVISIIGLLGVFTLSSLKGFSKDLPVNKVVGEVQTLLRLAQSNATSSTLCNNQGATSWYLNFTSGTVIQLNCDPGGVPRSYTLEDVQVVIAGDSCTISLPVKLSYSTGLGQQSWSSTNPANTNACLQSSVMTITISNTKNTFATPKRFKMSKGGAIDEQ